MDRQERLKYCKRCKNKKFDRKIGIVCGLTNEQPSFQTTCKDYDEDPKLIMLEEKKAKEKVSDEKERKAIKGTAILGFSIIILEIILVYFFNNWRNTSAILSRVVAFIVFGVILIAAYHELPFFEWRFRRAIRFWGKKRTRKITIVFASACLLFLICFRNYF